MLGCSLRSDGLSEGDPSLVDGAVDSTSGTSDTAEAIPDGTSIFDADVEDSTAVDSTVADAKVDSTIVDAKVDTAVPPDTKPDVLPDVRDADAPADAGCKAPTPTANPCSEIAHLEALATGQTMDGRADDFCDVPYIDYDNSKGVIHDPDPVPPALQTTVRIRVAWSSYGLHAHVSVNDPKIQVVGASEVNLWQADSVEMYVAGYDALTGQFDGVTKDIGAAQMIFAPAAGATPTRAMYFYLGTAKGSPPGDRWFHRATTGGYELEIKLPWADLKPTSMAAPVAGKKIALSWGHNNKHDDAKVFSVFRVKSPGPAGSCTQPFCDDRWWCTPILNP